MKLDDTQKRFYVLLDWGGNVEDMCEMTDAEAKKKNDDIFEKEQRLIRWAPKKIDLRL